MNSQKRNQLRERIRTLEGLTADERSALLGLLAESKPYGLVWEEKPEDVEERLRTELPILREVPERAIISDDPDAPNHILIEGDNLEALSTLAYTHEGRIDVIYIDPPYNTGNKDFVYNDSYVDKDDPYRHSKWLSFMSKRLRTARKLLSENGVMFISIGSDEIAQLTSLCDKMFGAQNQIAIVSRVQKKGNGKGTHFSPAVDYVLAYANDKTVVERFFAPNTSDFPVLENTGERKGEYYECSKSLYQSSLDSRPNQRYYIECPDGTLIIPPGHVFPEEKRDGSYVKPLSNDDKCWRWSWDSYLKQKQLLVFKKARKKTLVDGKGRPSEWNVYTKRYQKDAEEKGKVPPNYIDDCINSLGTSRISDIGLDFSFAKPCELIIRLIKFTNKKKTASILDFFAGSGTTLDAVMQLNSEDGGHRQCILVTNNENGICENVTYERNRRVIEGYTTPKGEARVGLAANTLRYYRTDFISRSRSLRNMRQLVRLATDMLCIKENIYTEEREFGGQETIPAAYRAFREGDRRMLVVYSEEAVEDLAELICDMDLAEPIIVYVFSPSEDVWREQWEDVREKVRLTALPAAIYNTYRRILPRRRDTPPATEQAAQGADGKPQPARPTLFSEEDMA